MLRISVLLAAMALAATLSGCIVGPAPGGVYYNGSEPYEPVPAYGYDPLYYGGGFYPRYYRHGYGTYNWGGWHHGGARGGFHGAGGGHGGGGAHGGGGHR